MSAPDALEWVLLAAALLGIWHHARNLSVLWLRCSGALPWAEVLLCRIYQRHERVRIAVKLTLGLVAIWLIGIPTPSDDFGDEIGRLFFRAALVGIALVLDWESIEAKRDRDAIGRGARARR